MRILAADFPPWAIFLIVLGVFAFIAIVAYIIHRILRFRLKEDEGNKEEDEKKFAQEELDRILQPVEDEKIAKQIEDYKEDE